MEIGDWVSLVTLVVGPPCVAFTLWRAIQASEGRQAEKLKELHEFAEKGWRAQQEAAEERLRVRDERLSHLLREVELSGGTIAEKMEAVARQKDDERRAVETRLARLGNVLIAVSDVVEKTSKEIDEVLRKTDGMGLGT